MRPVCIAIVILLAAFASPALAGCDEDTIDTVSSDGDLIVLASGEQYDVDAGDESTSASWQEGDNVLVCGGDVIIDKDEGGEQVDVTLH